jgi:hypothetical protein
MLWDTRRRKTGKEKREKRKKRGWGWCMEATPVITQPGVAAKNNLEPIDTQGNRRVRWAFEALHHRSKQKGKTTEMRRYR